MIIMIIIMIIMNESLIRMITIMLIRRRRNIRMIKGMILYEQVSIATIACTTPSPFSGSVIAAAGLCLSAYAPNVIFLYFSAGVLIGLFADSVFDTEIHVEQH